MDEPHVATEPEAAAVEAEKSIAEEADRAAFNDNEVEQLMEVERLAAGDEPTTSTESTVSEDKNYEEKAADCPMEVEMKAPEESNASALFDELRSESVEQFDSEKQENSELDTTAASTDQLDFTERSVNFSQLDVAHNDDSNDAFNALKESETDALDTPKEEVEELKEPDLSNTENQEVEQESEPPQEPMDTSEVADETSMPVEEEPSTTAIEKEGEATLEQDELVEQQQESVTDKTAENEDVSEVLDEDVTEPANEGEGVDDDLCLFGDESESGQPQDDNIDEASKDDATEESSNAEASTAVEELAARQEETLQQDDIDALPLKENEIREISEQLTEQSCLNCENSTLCPYKLLEESGEIKYLCSFNCVKEHREDNDDKYSFTQKKVIVELVNEDDKKCSNCEETKLCKYRFNVKVFSTVAAEAAPADEEGETPEKPQETIESTETKYFCDEPCFKTFVGDNNEKYIVREAQSVTVEVPQEVEEQEIPKIVARSDAQVESARIDREQSLIQKCAQCYEVTAKPFKWETLEFCNEKCLGQYQNLIGAACHQCNQVVSFASIGKLCVRFGSDIKQFCTADCFNEYKKSFTPCSLCSENLKINDKLTGTTKRGKNFCNEKCVKAYDEIINPLTNRPPYLCSVCNIKKSPEVVALLDGNLHRLCSNPCFSAFKFVNNVFPDQCEMCTKYFERKSSEAHTIFEGETPKMFCTQDCMTIFITKNRSIWKCGWCKVSKYNYDMIQKKDGKARMCSLNCWSLHEASKSSSSLQTDCDHCGQEKQPQYELTMSDASNRSFCTYQCVLGFQSQFSKNRTSGDSSLVVPAGTAKRIKPGRSNFDKRPIPVKICTRRGGRKPYNPITNRSGSPIPVPELTVQLERLSDLPSRVKVSSLSSLTGGPSSWTLSRGSSPVRTEYKTQVVTIPPLPKQVTNKTTMCKAITLNKAINCVPSTVEAECQTDDWLEQRIIVPVPIVVYVPQPMMMYSLPVPVAVPFVLPVPVPVFVPTTRNSANGIMKEIKKIQEKMPTDPYEAELLMMAEMVAGDKKREVTDSDSDENEEIEYGDGIENNSSFNEDLVQMAFKMAGNDFEDPPVDLENEMTANTISQTSNAYGDDLDPHSLQHHQLLLLQQQRDAAALQSNRGRKRIQQPIKPANNRNSTPNKRIKREMEVMQPEMPREPVEKPDANMCLKYTFGVNAWKQWVATKNADFEKSSIRRKPIKSEILQLTADELNYSLCMFVKEVRKPNGSEYAPDTIYYLVLGIQQYLYENGRIDNIFTDRYYEQFTDCLDEVAKKFSVLYNDSQYIVTRVEEEHLWECKQLGAHSPHVLLSTLMFFNTKHFNLVTVDEHMELSFSHIMKHWKRNPNQPGAAKVPGSRNVLLRFYPPQSSLEANSRKKKVYEQQENEENPLRCPVKLYEFYLSKCPESVKTRNDVFYLQPERSCVPDSPVWYSTQPLSREALSKMLHRVKMVKEINIALLTS